MITLSYGGGKQSIAIITLILEGKLQRPDLIVFADTSHEVQTTWDYLETYVQPALKQFDLQVQVVGHEYANWGITKGNSPETQAILLPAFTRQNGGKIGKMPTFCSDEWKQRPIRRWLKEHGITDTDVWLGISMDEVERMKSSGLNWYRHIYPLIELVPMNRNNCVSQIKNFGWPVPYKSRCYMCPNQSEEAWKQMKQLGNGDFDKAVKIEEEVRVSDPNIFFHPMAIPLSDAVKQSEKQYNLLDELSGFDGCDSGYCFT